MRHPLPLLAAALATAAFSAVLLAACGPEQMGDTGTHPASPTTSGNADASAADAPATPVGAQRHVVTFKYGAGVPPNRIADITERFAALRDSIPGVTAFEHGVNNSPEGLNKDITHVYLLTFADAAARDAYLPHPAHQRFVELLDGAVEDVFVIDYLVEE